MHFKIGRVYIGILLFSGLFINLRAQLPDSVGSSADDNMGIGWQHYSSKDYAAAASLFNLAASQYVSDFDTAKALYAYKLLGASLIRQEKTGDLLHHQTKILPLLNFVDEEVPAILTLLGGAAKDKGDFEIAHTYYDSALSRAGRLDSISPLIKYNIGSLFTNQGKLFSFEGDFDRAIANFNHALNIFSDTLIPTNLQRSAQASTLQNIGFNYHLKEDYHQALYYNGLVDSILDFYPNTNLKILNLNDQGIAHRELGNYATALTCFQHELALQKANDNKRGRTLKQIGETYLAMQQPDTARAYLLRGKVFREAEYSSLPHPNMAKLLKLLGDADHQQNKFQSALAWYTKAENRLRLKHSTTATPSGQSAPQNQLATILFPLDLLPVLQARARTYEAMHAQTGQREPLLQALATYHLADSTLGLVRQSLDLEGSKLTISGQARPLFEGGIRVALQLQQLEPEAPWAEQAFHFAEKNRATLLKEAVRKVDSRNLGIVPDSLWQQQRSLSLRLGNLRKALANIAPEKIAEDTASLRLEAQLFRSQLQLDSLQDAIAAQYPSLTAFLGQNRAISATDVQAHLAKDQSLVEYFVGDSAVFAFCLGQAGLKVVDLGKPVGLRAAIDQVRAFTDSDTVGKDDYLLRAAALYTRLIAPLRGALPGTRLVVVPDGILHLLPFELLLQNADALPFRELPYLFRTYALSYQFSCGLMLEKGSPKPLAKADVSWAGFAPEFSLDRSGLPPLRGAQEEVAAVARQFAAPQTFGRAAANKAAFMHALSAAVPPHIVHLACHAQAGSASETAAWIAFSDADSSFRLSLEEVYHLPNAPAMMVLSACETGAGPLATGEGAMSLARGFYLSGSRVILNSMWQVRDGSSAFLMEEFYRGLRGGKPLDVALQQAMLAYLDSEEFGEAYMAPHFWAGFRITGAATPLQTQRSSAIWWMLFGFVTTGLLYWRYQQRQARKA